MDYSQSIANHGAAAVKKYRNISGIRNDNEIPEIFLGGQIAIGLHDEFRLQCHVERRYDLILQELGFPLTQSVIDTFGSQRADAALYRDGKPLAIIELKICDERDRYGDKLKRDLRKMRKLANKTGIEIYLGTLMTDVCKAECVERRTSIEKKLESCFSAHSSLEPAGYGADWKWQFLAGRLSGEEERDGLPSI